MKIGIIREGKVPPDKRVPFTPEQVGYIKKHHPEIEIFVQPSPIRCFHDSAYAEAGATLTEDLSHCDHIFGIKEVPLEMLINHKTYYFFSHTIKKQPHNKKLMRALLDKRIRMVDYETMVDEKGVRLVAFGKFAGIVGAYNGLLTFGKRTGLFKLTAAHKSSSYQQIIQEVRELLMPSIKIVVTGSGRVANGAIQLLQDVRIRQVTPEEYLNEYFEEPVFCQLKSEDYAKPIDGTPYTRERFHANPQEFESAFAPYAEVTDLFVNCIYFDPRAPRFFSLDDCRSSDFKISVIADVSCDIDGSVPCTVRASTIADPIYGFDPETGKETAPHKPGVIDIMAIDNLPCELPADASSEFGEYLIRHVLPGLLEFGVEDPMIHRATICEEGHLTERFSYLKDYAAQ